MFTCIVLYLPDDKIIFTGDLVFIGMHPYMADGYIEEWKDYLTVIENLSIEKLVPGHGNIGDAKDLQVMKEYLEMIEEKVQEMISNGLSISAAESIDALEPYTEWWFDNFFTINLRFMYENINK